MPRHGHYNLLLAEIPELDVVVQTPREHLHGLGLGFRDEGLGFGLGAAKGQLTATTPRESKMASKLRLARTDSTKGLHKMIPGSRRG